MAQNQTEETITVRRSPVIKNRFNVYLEKGNSVVKLRNGIPEDIALEYAKARAKLLHLNMAIFKTPNILD